MLPMSRQIPIDHKLADYIQQVTLREHPVLKRCREETQKLDEAVMQIDPTQGQFMQMLVKLTGARCILEIGTFTGYSSLSMAMALPEGGRIVACDINDKWAAKARGYWEEAGVADRIDLRIGDALRLVNEFKEEGQVFDLVFIDADKGNYNAYYEAALEMVPAGGLVLLDNTLWSGRLVDSSHTTKEDIVLRGLNEKLHRDNRIDLSLVPIGDGVTMARKR